MDDGSLRNVIRGAGVLPLLCITVTFAASASGAPQEGTTASSPLSADASSVEAIRGYVLGADDVIAIKALDAEEISNASIRIDPSGGISLPMLGRVTAGGLTIDQLERELCARLKTYVREPVVAVSVVEYRSQPVSVIGAVGQAGVHQLEGRKTLIEVLATAGGLRPEAGNIIKITRKTEWGPIPLPSSVKDPTGQFTVAEVSLNEIMRATNPEENILILPHDVITIPRADLVYVIGEVKKPGGFVLHERGAVSGLQALALAEGFAAGAAADKAVIIRASDNTHTRANLREILNGKKPDVQLLPNDILLIPNNVSRNAIMRTIQTALQAAAAAAVYRGVY